MYFMNPPQPVLGGFYFLTVHAVAMKLCKFVVFSLNLQLACWSILSAQTVGLDLGRPFQDNAVLQHGRPLPIWGTAASGQSITVSLDGNVRKTISGADGRWEVIMPASKPTLKPYAGISMQVTAGDQAINLKNLLFGDVWIA